MVVDTPTERETDKLFKAIADSTRRDILRQTMREDASVSSLAGRYAMSFAAVQKHVSVLERAELITKHRRGREQLVRANTDTIHTARGLLDDLEQLWCERIDRFGEILAESEQGSK